MMQLTMVPTGKRVRLVSVDAGQRLQARLASMGLVPGTEVEVIANQIHGPFIVSTRGSRLVLGRGMASRILVR